MNISDMVASLRAIIGDEDSTNYHHTDNVLIDKIDIGAKRLSARWSQEYVITGTGPTRAISPEPTKDDLQMIYLMSAMIVLDGEITEASRNAISVTSPAGRTDLMEIPKQLRATRKEVSDELNLILSRKEGLAVVGDTNVADASI